jgi:dipeptidyl aminopeptidase/acylaminoacyl peptidase
MRSARRWALLTSITALVALPAAPAHAGRLVFEQVSCNDDPAGCRSFWVVGDDGTGLRELPVENALNPTWSPDGARIAYQAGRGIRSIAVDGSDERVILDPGESYAGAPDWSPTDDLIAFAFTDQSGPGFGGGTLGNLYESDVYTIHADGSGMRRVAGGPGNEDSVRFTPDGRRLEFYRGTNPFVPDGPEAGLYSVSLDGTGERRLTLGDGVAVATPSPDGRHLAFLRSNGTVWTVDASGANLRSWTPPGGSSDGPLRWSPEGPKLYFLSSSEPRPPYASRTVHVADLSRPAAGATPVLAGDRVEVFFDWFGGVTARPRADHTPPAVVLLDSRGARASAAAAPRRTLSKRSSQLFAFDMTGIRKVQVAITRPGRRGQLRTIHSGAGFTKMIQRLRPGRYSIAFRTQDVRGNHRLSRLSRVTVRP